MHEYSIVASLLEMCEDYATTHNAQSVATIRIAIGEHSGVDRMLIQNTFETFKLDSPPCQNATLEIQIQPICLCCQICKNEFEAHSHASCPQCSSSQLTMSKGKELYLLSLELDVLEEDTL